MLLRSRSCLRLERWPRLWLGSRAWLRSWSLHLLWTGLRHWLWGWPVLRLGLRLNRAVVRLFRAELRLLRPWLRLDWTRLLRLGLDRARLRLDGTNLGLLWLNGTDLRLVGSVVRLYGPDLGLAGADFGLTGSYLRLARLYLWPIVWFARTKSWLAGAGLGLAGPIWHGSGVGAREARLRGDWPGCCNHGWAAFVHVVELLTVLLSFTLVLDLGGHGRDSGTAHGFDFCWPRSVSDAASASVIGDAGVVIDDDCAVVDIVDMGADAVDGAVVVEVVAAPIASVIADAGVAKAVVDAAVKADVRAPESAAKAPTVVVPAPVAGGPESTVIGWSAPCAGDPVVAGGSPVPVAGGPDIVWRGSFRLLVDGQGRWRRVGVFDGRGLAFFVELLGGLRVLIGLVLIGRGRSGLLGRILLDTLLRLGLGANSEDRPLSCGCGSRWWLAVGDGRQVGVGRIGAGVVGSRSGFCIVRIAVATCRSDER